MMNELAKFTYSNGDFYEELHDFLEKSGLVLKHDDLLELKREFGINLSMFIYRELYAKLYEKNPGKTIFRNPIAILSEKDLLAFVDEAKLFSVPPKKSIMFPPCSWLINCDFIMKYIGNNEIFGESFVKYDGNRIADMSYDGVLAKIFGCVMDLHTFDDVNDFNDPNLEIETTDIRDPQNEVLIKAAYETIQFELDEFCVPVGCIYRKLLYGDSKVILQCPLKHIFNYSMSVFKDGGPYVEFMEKIMKLLKRDAYFDEYYESTFVCEGFPQFGREQDLIKLDNETFACELDYNIHYSKYAKTQDFSLLESYCVLLASLHKHVCSPVTFAYVDWSAFHILRSLANRILDLNPANTVENLINVFQTINHVYSLYCCRFVRDYQSDSNVLLTKFKTGAIIVMAAKNARDYI